MLLETHAPGATLACRLEDREGWPLVAVPAPCSMTATLQAGRYVWTQLPLSVESQISWNPMYTRVASSGSTPISWSYAH